jgi:hypothetical protein
MVLTDKPSSVAADRLVPVGDERSDAPSGVGGRVPACARAGYCPCAFRAPADPGVAHDALDVGAVSARADLVVVVPCLVELG